MLFLARGTVFSDVDVVGVRPVEEPQVSIYHLGRRVSLNSSILQAGRSRGLTEVEAGTGKSADHDAAEDL